MANGDDSPKISLTVIGSIIGTLGILGALLAGVITNRVNGEHRDTTQEGAGKMRDYRIEQLEVDTHEHTKKIQILPQTHEPH